MKSDIPALAEILTRIERIQSSGVDKATLADDLLLQDGIIRNLEVIGEASKRLSSSAKSLTPEVPWARIAGFRDVAIQSYDKLDFNRVWKIVETELPRLKTSIRRLLKKL